MPLVILLLSALLLAAVIDASARTRTIRVLGWSERTEPADLYPNGINGAMAEMLKRDKQFEVKTANLDDPEQGLSEAALGGTSVLIWFGHNRHKEVSDESVA